MSLIKKTNAKILAFQAQLSLSKLTMINLGLLGLDSVNKMATNLIVSHSSGKPLRNIPLTLLAKHP